MRVVDCFNRVLALVNNFAISIDTPLQALTLILKKTITMSEREMKVTQEQMAEARIDLAYRDYCAHLLIPLNRCRRRTVSLK